MPDQERPHKTLPFEHFMTEFMQKTGLDSTHEFATAVDLPHKTVMTWLTGKASPTLNELVTLADNTGRPINEVITLFLDRSTLKSVDLDQQRKERFEEYAARFTAAALSDAGITPKDAISLGMTTARLFLKALEEQ